MKTLFKIVLFVFFAQLIVNNITDGQNDFGVVVNQEQKATLHDSNNDFLLFVVNENARKSGLLQFSNNIIPPQLIRTLPKRTLMSAADYVQLQLKMLLSLAFNSFPAIKLFTFSKSYFVLALRRIVI